MPAFRLVLVALSALALVPHQSSSEQQAGVDPSRLMRDVEVLAADAMEGREAGTPGGARAREYILARFKEAGVEPLGGSYEHRFTFPARERSGTRTGVNVVGVIRGRKAPGRYIALTAHYDHIGVREGKVYNGADDNATGVAAILALAAHFSRNRPAHSLLVAALDAEEAGLQGAEALVRRGPIPRSAIALNVNVDMVGRDPGNILYAAGISHYPFLKGWLEGIAQPPVTLRFGHDAPDARAANWTRDSDHYAFHRAGIPFVYFGVENEEHHHRPTDDVETIQPAFFAGAVRTILAAVERIDAALGSAGGIE